MTPTFSGAIDHVHVYVPSRQQAADWYAQHLGFEIVEKYAFWATDDAGPLTIGDASGRIHFALFRASEPRPVSLAFGASAREYGQWKRHLGEHHIDLREQDHTLSKSLYFCDPFGNQLEITTFELN